MSEQAVFDALKYRIEDDGFGTRRYYNTAGQLHRTNGPAIEYANGTKYWCQNSLIHRTDGPAIEWVFTNGYINKEWYIDDTELTEEEFNQEVKDYERTRSI